MSSDFLKIGNLIPDFQEIAKKKRRMGGFTIYENFGFTRLRDTAETPRQAIDEAVGRTAR